MKFKLVNSRRSLYLFAGLLACVLQVSALAQNQRDETQTPATTGAITGRVITERGEPLPNASVILRGSQALFQPRQTATDSEGNFRVTGLEPLLYGVVATAPAYVMPTRDQDTEPNYYRLGDSITVSLVKGGVITGTVQSSSGEPVVQVGVKAVMVRDVNDQVPKYTPFQMQRATDDRGVYRIYGLVPGTYVVAAGGRGVFMGSTNPYDTDAATYAPSGTRETAVEINVRAGEETGGVDIRYRGEPGRSISGVATGAATDSPMGVSVTMSQIVNGTRMSGGMAFQQPGGKGFAFFGVSDGAYELQAQSSVGQGEMLVSEPRSITVKGTDVGGIELILKPLGSISGRVVLEKSEAPECKNKRRPLLSETLLMARRNEKGPLADQPLWMLTAQASPVNDGEFLLRNLKPGQYNLNARFFAKYWYLRSISEEPPPPITSALNKPSTTKRQIDLAKEGLALKTGERHKNVTFSLTEGAASLRGTIKLGAGEAIPPKLYVHLVPAEKDSTDDVLRFFSDAVKADGTFALNNLPPGRYWGLARIAGDNELPSATRTSGEQELRNRIRRAAEAAKTEIEFKPCQNVTDYSLSYR